MSKTIILQLDEKDARWISHLLRTKNVKSNNMQKYYQELRNSIIEQIEAQSKSNGQFFQCEACYDAQNG